MLSGGLADLADRIATLVWTGRFALAALVLWRAVVMPAPPEAGMVQVPLFAALCLAALTVGIAEAFRDNAAQTVLPAILPDAGLKLMNILSRLLACG